MSIVSISERIMMKKLLILGLSASFLLAGYTSIQRILRGDEYVDSSLAASSKAAESSRLKKEKKDSAEIGRASCREKCRSRWSPYH